jgi:methylated-DNA-[protein]-cysteine S-methyltransferase
LEHKISFKTNFGWINAKELDDYVVSVSFGKLNKNNPSKTLNKLKKNIQNYFLGQELVWKFKLKIIGSPLQKKIWKELQKIPYGKTRSYGFIAKKLKTSPRYVGNVCGQNKHLLIIPCHRVVRSDGQLGGFSGLGGIKLKKRLLNLEN